MDLQLTSIFNVRDLGGYATPSGTTKHHRFVRSGDTMFLTPEDLAALRDYGVRRVADLRMACERPESDPFSRCEGIAWANFSMADESTMYPDAMQDGSPVISVLAGYRRMLADAAGLQRLFAFLASPEPGECLLFHCANGMDRSGLVALLILGSAGVSEHDILIDYARSFGSDAEIRELEAAWNPQEPYATTDGLLARAQAMSALMDHIARHHGSVQGLLRHRDVPQAHIDAIVRHLLA